MSRKSSRRITTTCTTSHVRTGCPTISPDCEDWQRAHIGSLFAILRAIENRKKQNKPHPPTENNELIVTIGLTCARIRESLLNPSAPLLTPSEYAYDVQSRNLGDGIIRAQQLFKSQQEESDTEAPKEKGPGEEGGNTASVTTDDGLTITFRGLSATGLSDGESTSIVYVCDGTPNNDRPADHRCDNCTGTRDFQLTTPASEESV